MVDDFLFELGCEELPSGAVRTLADALKQSIIKELDKLQLSYQSIQAYATPRRIAILIHELRLEQPAQTQVRKGPARNAAYNADGQPTPALQGFAKSCGVSIDELSLQTTEKGEWFVYEQRMSGVKTSQLLPTIIQQALKTLPIAKPMRWGESDEEFVRPVHWAVMLLGDQLIDCTILGLTTQRYTHGHRFHAPDKMYIDSIQQYEALLQDAYVIADFSKRRQLITQQISQLAKQYDADVIMPDELLDEVTSIVEWPESLIASFDKTFLDVPAEALIASMQTHQKCFALQSKQSKLLPYFITVSNLRSLDPQQVVQGNEKVMRARLSDAAFFFNQDKKQPLSSHIDATAKVIFQTKLGTLKDKTQRIQQVMRYLATHLELDNNQAMRAAELSKCDLMTGMVGEFPELQGLMGYYYAEHDAEAAAVAKAIFEQYLPRFSADKLPETDLGRALSIADRLDTLVGIFSIGQKPTGDKDPFKLRRHALAIIRLLMQSANPLLLSELIAESKATYGTFDNSAVDELPGFILDRLQAYYQSLDISSDVVLAVRESQSDQLYDLDLRIRALAQFVDRPEMKALSAASKRVNNLLQQAGQNNASIDETLLHDAAEKNLYAFVKKTQTMIQPLYAQGNYVAILEQLAALREPVDAFFDKVMVMVDDANIKANRLALLQHLNSILLSVADISLLQAN